MARNVLKTPLISYRSPQPLLSVIIMSIFYLQIKEKNSVEFSRSVVAKFNETLTSTLFDNTLQWGTIDKVRTRKIRHMFFLQNLTKKRFLQRGVRKYTFE